MKERDEKAINVALSALKDPNDWEIFKALAGKTESTHPNLLTGNETKILLFINKAFGLGPALTYLGLIAGNEGIDQFLAFLRQEE